MASKPYIVMSCESCSHNRTEFHVGCGKGRHKDEHEHWFCPEWNLSSKAKEISLIKFAWANGLDRSKIRSKNAVDWFKREVEDGK